MVTFPWIAAVGSATPFVRSKTVGGSKLARVGDGDADDCGVGLAALSWALVPSVLQAVTNIRAAAVATSPGTVRGRMFEVSLYSSRGH